VGQSGRPAQAASIALLPRTTLGAAPFAVVYDLAGPEFQSVFMENQFDAILYLGPPLDNNAGRTVQNQMLRQAVYADAPRPHDPGPMGPV
jgi:hypothetical protein